MGRCYSLLRFRERGHTLRDVGLFSRRLRYRVLWPDNDIFGLSIANIELNRRKGSPSRTPWSFKLEDWLAATKEAEGQLGCYCRKQCLEDGFGSFATGSSK